MWFQAIALNFQLDGGRDKIQYNMIEICCFTHVDMERLLCKTWAENVGSGLVEECTFWVEVS